MSNFQKQAGIGSTLKKILQNGGAHLLGGAGTALGMDVMMNPDEEFLGGEWDKRRIGNTVLNAGLGALGGGLISTGKQKEIIAGLAALTSAPAKDLMMSSQSTLNKVDKALDVTTEKLKNQPTDTLNNTLKWVGGGALGLGGLALLTQLFKKDKETTSLPSTGTLKYKILGKKDDPNDDIEVELPVDTAKFTPDMNAQIDSYIKRQAKKAIRNNARKRDPETGKLIPYELYMKKYGPIKSASFMDGLTNKPVPEYKKEETETPSTIKEFHRLQAGAKLNTSGATVKSARAFHEGAGTVLTGITGAGAGALLGKQLTPDNPLLGLLAGGAIGGLTPYLGGKALAAVQELDRSEEEQKAHDDKAAGLEYLIPGYAAYNSSRRKDVKVTGNSFAATGMNPVQESYGTTIEDAIIDEEEEEEPYDIIEKYANQVNNNPPPKPGVGSGPAPAQVKNQSNTARRQGETGDMQNVQHAMANVQSTIANTKLS